jgi:hypothetical protein
VIVGVATAFVLAAGVSLVLISLGRLGRHGSIPLGAYLGTGTALVVWIWH